MSSLLKMISPDCARRSPVTVFKSVVFPAPFAPMIVTISPGFMCSDTRRRTLKLPYPASRFRSLSIVLPQVDPDNLRIVLDGAGRVVGDLFAVGEDDDLVGNVHDQGHIVLDDQDGDAEVPDPGDEPRQVSGLAHVEPGSGLIQKKHRRLARERAGKFDRALLAVGKTHGVGRGKAADTHEVHDLEGLYPDLLLLTPGPGEVQHAGDEPGTAYHVASHHDVLEGGHVRKEPDVLEGARQAAPRDLMGAQSVDRRVTVDNSPGVGREEARDEVEERRLSRAVRPDDRLDAAAVHRKAYILHGLEPA